MLNLERGSHHESLVEQDSRLMETFATAVGYCYHTPPMTVTACLGCAGHCLGCVGTCVCQAHGTSRSSGKL